MKKTMDFHRLQTRASVHGLPMGLLKLMLSVILIPELSVWEKILTSNSVGRREIGTELGAMVGNQTEG